MATSYIHLFCSSSYEIDVGIDVTVDRRLESPPVFIFGNLLLVVHLISLFDLFPDRNLEFCAAFRITLSSTHQPLTTISNLLRMTVTISSTYIQLSA